MILTQPQKRRHFVGSLNSGDELVETLRALCVDNKILCGSFSGQGYLLNPKMRSFDGKGRKYRDPIVHDGTFHCVSLEGTISLVDNQTSIRCHAVGALVPETPAGKFVAVSGEILEAEVLGLEFTLDTADDIRLYRDHDSRSGLDAWLHVSFVMDDGPIYRHHAAQESAPAQAREQAPQTTDAPSAGGKELATAEGTTEVHEGDFLDHPTLGRCEVVDAEQSDRITIRLESGRLVELHTGLITVEEKETKKGGKRVFAVAIKRRRG